MGKRTSKARSGTKGTKERNHRGRKKARRKGRFVICFRLSELFGSPPVDERFALADPVFHSASYLLLEQTFEFVVLAAEPFHHIHITAPLPNIRLSRGLREHARARPTG
jgi:hypothetical protein